MQSSSCDDVGVIVVGWRLCEFQGSNEKCDECGMRATQPKWIRVTSQETAQPLSCPGPPTAAPQLPEERSPSGDFRMHAGMQVALALSPLLSHVPSSNVEMRSSGDRLVPRFQEPRLCKPSFPCPVAHFEMRRCVGRWVAVHGCGQHRAQSYRVSIPLHFVCTRPTACRLLQLLRRPAHGSWLMRFNGLLIADLRVCGGRSCIVCYIRPSPISPCNEPLPFHAFVPLRLAVVPAGRPSHPHPLFLLAPPWVCHSTCSESPKPGRGQTFH